MKKFLLIDANHLMNRTRHTYNDDILLKTGMALSIIFFSIKKMWNDFDADHVVFCFDSKSWRLDHYKQYKLKREIDKQAKTEQEVEDDNYYWGVMNEFEDFLREKTNCTILRKHRIEADDFIARWVKLHPNDQHIIVSGDNDFVQLVDKNVCLYNGITETLIKHDGIFDIKGKKVFFNFKNDGKISIPNKKPKDATPPDLPDDWVERSLFFKVMRGDVSDGIFSAAKPGTRQPKLEEAFDDRKAKGFLWNNLMLSSWVDHNGDNIRVLERYNFNQLLIDLTKQPDDIREIIDSSIIETLENNKKKSQVGVALMKFCNKHELVRVLNNIKQISPCFSSSYPME